MAVASASAIPQGGNSILVVWRDEQGQEHRQTIEASGGGQGSPAGQSPGQPGGEPDPVPGALAGATRSLVGQAWARQVGKNSALAAVERIRRNLAMGMSPNPMDATIAGYSSVQEATELAGKDRSNLIAAGQANRDAVSAAAKKHPDGGWKPRTPEEAAQDAAAKAATAAAGAAFDNANSPAAIQAKRDKSAGMVSDYNKDLADAKRAGMSVADLVKARQRNALRFGGPAEQDAAIGADPNKARLQRELIDLSERRANTTDPTERQRLLRRIEQLTTQLELAEASA